MAAADHDVMGDHDAARCNAAVSCVIGNRAADAAHQTACEGHTWDGGDDLHVHMYQLSSCDTK